MQKNKIVNWKIESLNNLNLNNIDLESVFYKDTESLNVNLIIDNCKLNLKFDKFISFRATDESFLLDYWNLMLIEQTKGLAFFKIKNSSYLDDITNLSVDFVSNKPTSIVEHYAIFLKYDLCIEILSSKPPLFSMVTSHLS